MNSIMGYISQKIENIQKLLTSEPENKKENKKNFDSLKNNLGNINNNKNNKKIENMDVSNPNLIDEEDSFDEFFDECSKDENVEGHTLDISDLNIEEEILKNEKEIEEISGKMEKEFPNKFKIITKLDDLGNDIISLKRKSSGQEEKTILNKIKFLVGKNDETKTILLSKQDDLSTSELKKLETELNGFDQNISKLKLIQQFNNLNDIISKDIMSLKNKSSGEKRKNLLSDIGILDENKKNIREKFLLKDDNFSANELENFKTELNRLKEDISKIKNKYSNTSAK